MLDNIGRSINYLRVSLTDRCNLRCIYCMPESGINKKNHEDVIHFEEVEKIIKIASELGVTKVRFTGGEPLILRGIETLIEKTAKLKNVKDVAITTNGILFSDKAKDLKKAGLKRANISLDTLKEDKFKEITRGGNINSVFSAIDKALSLNFSPLKVNTVLMKGINDDEVGDFINLTKALPIQVRFIELMPIGEGEKYFEKCSMNVDSIINKYSDLKPINDESKVASVYKIDGYRGSVGFIRPMSCKFCSECNKIRLTSMGTIKLCLHSREEVDLKPYLNDESELKAVISRAIFEKPEEHNMEIDNKSKSLKKMYQIGG